MQYKEKEIKEGIKLHQIQTEKFKTNLVAILKLIIDDFIDEKNSQKKKEIAK